MTSLFPMIPENVGRKADYFLGADLLDVFDGTESDYSSTGPEEEEVIEKKPVSFKVSGKAPRPGLSVMVANSTSNTTNSDDEEEDDEEEEEEGRIIQVHHQLLGPAAKKSPFFQRRTREEKIRISIYLTRVREVEDSRRSYQKKWSNLSMSFLSLGSIPRSMPMVERKKENLLEGFNTRLLNYNQLSPLLFQNQLKVSTSIEDGFQCHKMLTPLSTIIIIRVRL